MTTLIDSCDIDTYSHLDVDDARRALAAAGFLDEPVTTEPSA